MKKKMLAMLATGPLQHKPSDMRVFGREHHLQDCCSHLARDARSLRPSHPTFPELRLTALFALIRVRRRQLGACEHCEHHWHIVYPRLMNFPRFQFGGVALYGISTPDDAWLEIGGNSWESCTARSRAVDLKTQAANFAHNWLGYITGWLLGHLLLKYFQSADIRGTQFGAGRLSPQRLSGGIR
jgi:hypothetical protein